MALIKSEEALIERVFSKLEEGAFVDCLHMKEQVLFDEWIQENDLLDGSDFGLRLGISRKVVLWCRCFLDLTGDEPLYRVKKKAFGKPKTRPDFVCDPTFFVRPSWLDPKEILG